MNHKLKTFSISFIVGLGLIIIPILLSPVLFNPLVSASSAQEKVELVELRDNLGNYHYPISTTSNLAQKYFDQGLILAYGFNHAEAARAFKEASRLDPNCAMCYWGLAYVLGPNINAPMADEQVPEAWQAIQQAIALSNKASPKEQAYIKALAQRYSEQPMADRSSLDLAYGQAMKQVVQDYPDDLDAATLYAESLMDTMPWDYWQDNGELKPEAKPILATLESVLERNPKHPGATHFYIHASEKEQPKLAIEAADSLRNLVPASGHLVHMPSHIYIRVGRYQDAVIANQKGVMADRNYLSSPHPQSIYTIAYVPHNYHFLWFAAVMSGQSEIAMEAAQKTAAVDPSLMANPGLSGKIQHFSVVPLYTEVRFGKWDKILETPAPKTDLKYATGVWHYSRGMAFTSQGKKEEANQELAKLQGLVADPDLEKLKISSLNSTPSVLKIALEVLTGSIATLEQDYTTATSHLKNAVTLEDKLVYNEPPDWYSPTRYLLGTILLQGNQPEQAEQAFRDDLDIYPENGWSLHGLAKSLQAQGKTAEAETIQQQFQQAWQYADIAL
ncbi:hypothetical protein [Moorena sp. SIO4G3]|uniref:tetratricopeptide repeat protein n=1 Tax=Moorena sp. SIO4G3 TaxID=2607821 RepID=UPI0025D27325|nr:hypothetical protein [Moorena sp. SIO4G3]